MSNLERQDDFDKRRTHLQSLSDEELHDRFWELVNRIVDPLIEEARTHTTPAIERSVLLRMGLSSIEAKQLVDIMVQQNLLGHGAGRLLLELSEAKQLSVRETAQALIAGQFREELAR